ncbi:MAG TPA: hypothetical protein PKD09_17125 [Aggregatilinea sp.]|uniref:hypothetical protein n=1 Tax=Aggregatilinea sp. TaxID=2806333 RepID=UPI002BBC412B|nr:hypothetical protein [Aggregatilinea sp.]HML23381.1 hypothetical protein [Aggregatilinea sp.]
MRRLVGIIVLVSLFVVPTAAAQEGPSQHLPADLLYVTLGDVEGADYQRPNTLMRLDAETLTPSVFYYDASVEMALIPVSWSPSGTYLTVIRDNGDEVIDLCLITYGGIRYRCFEKVINREKYGNRTMDHQPYWVTWSEDEQSIYFYQDEGDTIRLVEANIASGDVVRTVYEQTKPYPQNMASFYWPQSLSYIMAISFREAVGLEVTGDFLVGNEIYDVEVVSPDADGSFSMATEITPLFDNRTRFCPGLSPDETRFVALHYSDNGYPEILFLAATGETVESVPASYFQAQGIRAFKCPTWEPDSDAVYFLGRSPIFPSGSLAKASLYRYELGGEEPVPYVTYEAFGLEGDLYLGDYLVPTPDGATVAFTYAPQNFSVWIGIATADGTVVHFKDIRPYVSQLLWFPEDK